MEKIMNDLANDKTSSPDDSPIKFWDIFITFQKIKMWKSNYSASVMQWKIEVQNLDFSNLTFIKIQTNVNLNSS